MLPAVANVPPETTTVCVAGVGAYLTLPDVTSEATIVYDPSRKAVNVLEEPRTERYELGPVTVTDDWTPGGNPSTATERLPVLGAVGESWHAATAATTISVRRVRCVRMCAPRCRKSFVSSEPRRPQSRSR
jgi:hypothetical protein